MRDIGKNIRTIRMQQGLTQDELADRLYVTRQTISNYETGRSRPDVDTLLALAATLNTDANTLLYGPPIPPDRQTECRRFEIALAVTAVFGLCLALSWKPAATLLRQEFLSGPIVILQLFLLPVFYVLLGWTGLCCIGLLTKAKPLRSRGTRIARCAVLGLLSICLALLLPHVLFNLHSTLLHVFFLNDLRGSYSFSSGFLLRPAGLNTLSHCLSTVIHQKQPLFLLFGALLWLFDRPEKGTLGKRKDWLIPLLGLCLGLGLYAGAARDCVVGIADPAALTDVPPGIQIIQQTPSTPAGGNP